MSPALKSRQGQGKGQAMARPGPPAGGAVASAAASSPTSSSPVSRARNARQQSSHCHSAVFDQAQDTLLVCDLGADQVRIYTHR